MKMQHRIVTILLLAWVAMFAVSGFSQVFTAAGTTGPIDQTNSGIYNHRLTWTGAGTRTTCTVKLEQSIDGVTWTDLIAAQVCTTNGTATATGYANYVRMNVTALAGAGNTVYPRYDGTPVAATVGAVTIAPGATVTSDQGAVGANAWKVVGTGTAGTPGTAVLTVQGVGSGTAVPVSGTVTATVTGATGSFTADVTKQGGATLVAAGTGIAGYPLPVATRSVTTQSAAVANGASNYVDSTSDGRLLVKEAAPPQDEWQATLVLTDTTATSVKAAVADYYLVITAVLVTNSHATVGTVVNFTDAVAGATIYSGYAAAGGGGWAQGNGVGSLFIVPTVSHALGVTCGTTGSNTIVSVRGYKSKIAP